ncbi:MAG: PorV/PorQ family protein [Calditrichaeota bacterium]|nr:PorV/PorQ family protein [Calditrichota bacterium]
MRSTKRVYYYLEEFIADRSRMLIGILLAGAIIFAAHPLLAVSKKGTSVAQFLKIGVGARAAAMGSAFVGLANDVTALYWNPAGIARLDRPQFMAAHTEWFADLNHEFMGLSLPLGPSTALGVSFTAFYAPEMEQTTIEEPEGTGIYFDTQDIAIGLTYARRLTDRFSFGMTAKYVHQRLFNETASTFAVDIGGQLHTGFKGMRLGMVMTNFGGKMRLDGRDLIVSYDPRVDVAGNPLIESKLSTESWPLPHSFRIGIALDLLGKQAAVHYDPIQRITVTIDGYHVNDAAETLNWGAEYAWSELFFLRAGYRWNHDTERWSLGVGIRLPFQRWMVQADYAFAQMGDLGPIQRMQIGIQF